MPPPASVTAFPWGSLERVPRSVARDWGTLNRLLAAHAGTLATPLAQVLGRRLDAPVRFEWCSLQSEIDETSAECGQFELRVDPGPLQVSLQLDPRLVTLLVASALKHTGTLYDPRQAPDAALLGAAAAIVAKIIEEARLGIAVQFIDAPLAIPNALHVQLEVLLFIDSVAYRLCIGLAMNPLRAPARRRPNWKLLGRVPLALPLVIGTSLATRDVLAELAPDKAFLPGSGLWVDDNALGRGVLVAPLSDRGVGVELAPGGKIVLRDTNVTLAPDEVTSTVAMSPEAQSVSQALRDAPVVVRIELAAVSLPAQHWAELRIGDIVETGKPLGTEVVLRVAGQALAKGELLNIDGELGVRITKLLAEEA
jgi:flagellar motor switch/type III secretory pathway protein FliN